MDSLRNYLETKISVIKQQIDNMDTTITVSNHGLDILKDGMTKLQQS